MRLTAIIPALLLTLAACSPTSRENDSRIELTVSIEPQRALLEEIGGDRVSVTSLLSNGADPETFDPPMASIMALEKSAAWLQIGHMAFEHELEHRMAQGSSPPVTFDTSEGIIPVTGTHNHSHGDSDECDSHDHHHHHHADSADPHTWSSVKNLRVIADNMLRALLLLDPQDSAYYAERHSILSHRLDSLDADYTRRLAPMRGEAFMVWHPSLSYFARDYGLCQVAVASDHREVSLLQLQEVIDHAVDKGVKVFFEQSSYDPRLSATVRTHIGAICSRFDPLAYDWQSGLDSVVTALTQYELGSGNEE